MKPVLWAALAAASPVWAAAPAADPADPAASVPRMSYRSVFQAGSQPPEPAPADWKKSNADVGQFLRGHMDLLNWEAAQQPAARGAAPSAQRPATGAQGAAPARPATPGHQH